MLTEQRAFAQTQTERTFEMLKADILSCRLEPGALVSASALGSEYGAGLAAVRSALERMAAEGWVQALPQRGYQIAPITVQEVNELYAVSELITPRLARLSCGLIGDIVDELRELNRASCPGTPPMTDAEERQVRAAGDQILRRIREKSGNRFAVQITRQIAERIERIIEVRRRVVTRPYDSRRDFGPLIDALFNNDPNAAEAASLAGVRRSRERILNEILSIPGIATATIHAPMSGSGSRRRRGGGQSPSAAAS